MAQMTNFSRILLVGGLIGGGIALFGYFNANSIAPQKLKEANAKIKELQEEAAQREKQHAIAVDGYETKIERLEKRQETTSQEVGEATKAFNGVLQNLERMESDLKVLKATVKAGVTKLDNVTVVEYEPTQ